jgi:hypothetical protein
MENEKLKPVIKNQFTELKTFIQFIGRNPSVRKEAVTCIIDELYELIKDSVCNECIRTIIKDAITNNTHVLNKIVAELENTAE